MRQLFLDTETTGLEHALGHRILELAAVEMIDRKLTGKHIHFYIHPERAIDAEAQNVHGISLEFLADKPKFKDIAAEFLAFIKDAELIIHNAPFDTGFLDAELKRLKLPAMTKNCAKITDTLKMAREQFPGKKNNLNALCSRFEISTAERTLHGALLDSELLAEVYIAMTRGQDSLMDVFNEVAPTEKKELRAASLNKRAPVKVLLADANELAEHNAILQNIDKMSGGKTVWKNASLKTISQ